MIVEDQFIEAHDLQLMLERASFVVSGIARSVDEAIRLLESAPPDLVLLDIFLKGSRTGLDLARILQEKSIGFIYISANSSKKILDEAKVTHPYGFIVKPFRQQDVLSTLEIAFYRLDHGREAMLQQQLRVQKELLAIEGIRPDRETALMEMAKSLQPHLPFDYIGIQWQIAGEIDGIGFLRKRRDDYQTILPQRFAEIAELSLSTLEAFQQEVFLNPASHLPDQEQPQDSLALHRLTARYFGARSHISIQNGNGEFRFHLSLYAREAEGLDNRHLMLLRELEPLLCDFLTKVLGLKPQHVPVPAQPPRAIPKTDGQGALEEIVGCSQKILAVFDYIKRVAPSDTSVLILGESGTGKEKIAKAIHALSPRKELPFVVVDCSTVPGNLVESLLFGHEKGSFTGATEKKIGKFEAASGGTIFLDEIGELPPELQVKLLRVLQEREIERVGGSSRIAIDVRIVAATNRNLEEEIAAGRFRMDLYYRLHVFPITVPPLRERLEDLPLLVDHFIRIHGGSLGKPRSSFSDGLLMQLMHYPWPGNIRELEHLVQRSLLLSDRPVITTVDLPMPKRQTSPDHEHYAIKTIMEHERDYLIYILRKCKGKISGVNGAAELLDIHPSTLSSKLKKLGIKVHLYS